MRWQRLFDDLEAQLEAADSAELAAEVADRTRREAALLTATDRLSAMRGRSVGLAVRGGVSVTGRVVDLAPEWLLLEEPPAREVLVPWAAVLSVAGVGGRAGPPGAAGEVARRLGLGSALRGLARDRTTLTVTLTDGSRLTGTIDRVGADYVELAEHLPTEARRPGAVSGVRLVPYGALAVLRASD